MIYAIALDTMIATNVPAKVSHKLLPIIPIIVVFPILNSLKACT